MAAEQRRGGAAEADEAKDVHLKRSNTTPMQARARKRHLHNIVYFVNACQTSVSMTQIPQSWRCLGETAKAGVRRRYSREAAVGSRPETHQGQLEEKIVTYS